MNANEVLKKLPSLFDGVTAGDIRAMFQINVSQPCYIKIDNGTCEVIDGEAPKADLTIVATDENMIKLLKGQINSVMAMATGKVKVSGNVMLAQKMNSFFDMSRL